MFQDKNIDYKCLNLNINNIGTRNVLTCYIMLILINIIIYKTHTH